MLQSKRISVMRELSIYIGALLVALFVLIPTTSALAPLPEPDPIPGSYGLEATKTKAPPTRGATITSPASGASFTTSPITVAGVCPSGLLVQVYNNGVMVGAVMCERNSFSLQVSLFPGENEFTASVFDEVNQTGPKSNIVRTTYSDTRFSAFGEAMTLTSSYGRRSAGAGLQLAWPLQLSGGTGPYALSIDWGDGSDAELKSQALAGTINISHIYKRAGIYRINVKVTDANGVTAFLQLIAVSNGKIDATGAEEDEGVVAGATQVQQILWLPTIIVLVLLIPTYWLGRRSQLVTIRNKMLKERDSFSQS